MDQELEKLLEAARNHQMTPAEIEEQRISFAYGNAPEESKGSIETMRHASTYFKGIVADEK